MWRWLQVQEIQQQRDKQLDILETENIAKLEEELNSLHLQLVDKNKVFDYLYDNIYIFVSKYIYVCIIIYQCVS